VRPPAGALAAGSAAASAGALAGGGAARGVLRRWAARGRRARGRDGAQGRRARAAACLAALACCAPALGGCGEAQRSAAPPEASISAVLATPVASSVHTRGGTWATVPMGHLNQPLNTFWQLLYRPDGASAWSNRVEATAVATNGGLVLATPPRGEALVVAVRPSYLLHYTPLLATADGGSSWSNGLLDASLAARPYALAAGPSGQLLALVEAGPGHGSEAQESSRTKLSGWRALVSERTLAASAAGRACGLRSLTAAGFLEGRALIGASCARAGADGLLVHAAGGWRVSSGALPGALAHDSAEVLALAQRRAGAAALLRATGARAASLVASWYAAGAWHSSQPLALRPSELVLSCGPAGGGLFALLRSASGALRLALAQRPGARWRLLPAPPRGTATAAFLPGGGVQALAVAQAKLTVWTLDARRAHWTRAQTMNVPIEYGSSE